jgi:hypothetical protein
MKEKLKTDIIYDALLKYQYKLSSDNPESNNTESVEMKCLQEAIYQLEDINDGKAMIKNITPEKNIDVSINLSVKDSLDFLTSFVKGSVSTYNNRQNYHSGKINTQLKHCVTDLETAEQAYNNLPMYEQKTEVLIRHLFTFFLNIQEYMGDDQIKYMKKIFHDELKRRKNENS